MRFTREELLKETIKDIRYISIVGNSECTGEALMKHILVDLQECLANNSVLTILPVTDPHIYNIALEECIAIEQVELHHDILDPLNYKAFADWYLPFEKNLLNLLHDHFHYKEARKIEICKNDIYERIEELNALLRKLNLKVEIVPWKIWLTRTDELNKITALHAVLYENNAAYRSGYDNTIKKFSTRKIKRFKKTQQLQNALGKFEEINWEILELAYKKAAEKYVNEEAPLTLYIAEQLGYRKIKYAGSEPEAFIATRLYLLKNPCSIEWVDTHAFEANKITFEIDYEEIITRITGYSKKFPDALKRHQVFIKLLALLLYYAISTQLKSFNKQQDYITSLIDALVKKSQSGNNIQHRSPFSYDDLAFSPFTKDSEEETNTDKTRSRSSEITKKPIIWNSENIATLRRECQQLRHLLNEYSKPETSIANEKAAQFYFFEFDRYFYNVIEEFRNTFDRLDVKENNKKIKLFNKKFEALIEEGKERFCKIISLNSSHTPNKRVQSIVLANCLHAALNKIHKLKITESDEQRKHLAILAFELQSFNNPATAISKANIIKLAIPPSVAPKSAFFTTGTNTEKKQQKQQEQFKNMMPPRNTISPTKLATSPVKQPSWYTNMIVKPPAPVNNTSDIVQADQTLNPQLRLVSDS